MSLTASPNGLSHNENQPGTSSRSTALVSVAGLVGAPVTDPDGRALGTLADVVVRAEAASHPAVTGFVVRIADRRVWLPGDTATGVEQGRLTVNVSRVDLRDVERRPREIQLVADVLNHQVVDVHGIQVVRAFDLYLAAPAGTWRLVGVEAAWTTRLRRALPGRRGRRPRPNQVLDWAKVQSFDLDAGAVRLSGSRERLTRLRPAQLADLLEDLGRRERRALLGSLDPATAADALEEMEATEVRSLLQDVPARQAAELLVSMEPDEAVDALRDLPADERDLVLRAMPATPAEELRSLLRYAPGTAGGLMTSALVRLEPASTVGQAVRALKGGTTRAENPVAVAVVDGKDRLVADVPVLDLLGCSPETPLSELLGGPAPVTVPTWADLATVISTMTESRGTSVLVVDDNRRPVGRILADDVLDALTQDDEGRRSRPSRLSPGV